MKRLRRFFTGLIDRRITLQTKLTPITQFSDEDIFIVGYPKSGITWFQHLITGIYFGVDPELAPATLMPELIPDIHFKKYYRRFNTPMFFKTHHLPRPEYKRVVYLLRDGRDVMVSYYHYQMRILNEEVDFMAMVRDGKGLFPGKWHEHLKAWNANPYNAEKLVIKYEDLKQSPLAALTRFCEFAQIERNQSFLCRVIEQTDFARLQAKERDGYMSRPNKALPESKKFFRRGIVGSYKDEMPQDVLGVFLQDATPMLKEMGYV
jgi:hypothetical protein